MPCGIPAVIHLGRQLPAGSSNLPGDSASRAIAPLFGLAPDGVCRAASVTRSAVGSYPAVLRPPAPLRARTVSPSPDPTPGSPGERNFASLRTRSRIAAIGRLFSVALSIASRRPVVNRHPALRSPDFPPCKRIAQRPPGQLPRVFYAWRHALRRIRQSIAANWAAPPLPPHRLSA
jgi:hypothetical protein